MQYVLIFNINCIYTFKLSYYINTAIDTIFGKNN